jgi:hypothetical protein
MASDRLIHFVCTTRSHCADGDPGLTQYLGEWALCPELLAPDHEWYDTGGLPVRDAVAQWRELMDVDDPTQPTVPAA